MTLKTCRMCGKKVTAQSIVCPDCGARQPRTMIIDYTIILIVSIVLAITLISTYASQGLF